jgi:integrase
LLREYHRTVPLDYKRRLFPHPQGTLEKMQAALRKEDPAFTPHCLRHTYATTLLAKGIDIRTVAALMGDDTKTVINTYVHYTDEMRAAAAAEIKKIFL